MPNYISPLWNFCISSKTKLPRSNMRRRFLSYQVPQQKVERHFFLIKAFLKKKIKFPNESEPDHVLLYQDSTYGLVALFPTSPPVCFPQYDSILNQIQISLQHLQNDLLSPSPLMNPKVCQNQSRLFQLCFEI